MNGPWLSIVGIGEDGLAGLGAAAQGALKAAPVVFGGERHLGLLPECAGQQRRAWPSPLAGGIRDLMALRGTPVAVLASGDPLWFGIAATLLRHVPADEVIVLPAPSSFSLAAARLGWPLQDTTCLSLHGRPVAALAAHLAPGRDLLCLTSDGTTPAAIARLLVAQGYGPSAITVLGHLGGPAEARTDGTADSFDATAPDLNVTAIRCRLAEGAVPRAAVPGLPDDAFRHDGKLTKREVRAATLSKLMPLPGQRLWDVGAGCGSVAIEWLRASPGGSAIALEPRADRLAMIADNALSLGVPQLQVVEGTAPAALADLPDPDAVFIGGGLSDPAIAEACLARLPRGGRLVANAVTLEGQAVLVDLHRSLGGELCRIMIERAGAVGGLTAWRPAMPVMQFAMVKP